MRTKIRTYAASDIVKIHYADITKDLQRDHNLRHKNRYYLNADIAFHTDMRSGGYTARNINNQQHLYYAPPKVL